MDCGGDRWCGSRGMIYVHAGTNAHECGCGDDAGGGF